jgi:hypothetical protein
MKHMCPQDCDLVLQFHRSSVIAALSRDNCSCRLSPPCYLAYGDGSRYQNTEFCRRIKKNLVTHIEEFRGLLW